MGELQAPMHAGDGWRVHRKRKLWAHEGARSRLSKQKLSQEVKRSQTSSLKGARVIGQRDAPLCEVEAVLRTTSPFSVSDF